MELPQFPFDASRYRLHPTRRHAGFTIVELLVVITIIVIMMTLVVPAFTSIKGAGDVTKAAYDIAGTLDQARAYAMANNTYVFVGIAEVDASKNESEKSQVAGIGRVAVAVFASKNGTRDYDVSNRNLTSAVWASYSNFAALNKLQHFENLHLAQTFATLPNTGGMTRTPIFSQYYQLGNAAVDQCVTPFEWPLGSSIGAGQYSFKRVINFDPQGVARIQYQTNGDDIVQYMEIGLQPAHGNVVSSAGNSAAIQIDGMTGSTRIYRP